MTDEIKKQILAVRDTGLVNMFDVNGVQRIAYDNGYYALVCYIEEHPKDYTHFIMTGKEK